MIIPYKYLGVLTRQFAAHPEAHLVLVAMRHEPKSVKEKWYQPRDELKPLIAWASKMNDMGYNIYACWASFRQRERTMLTMKHSAAFVADWDNGTPKLLDDTIPTIKVQTSPGRWQYVYTHALEGGNVVGETYKALVSRLPGLDKISGDPVHLWRVPGFVNIPKREKNRKNSQSTWDGKTGGKIDIEFNGVGEDVSGDRTTPARRRGRPLLRWMIARINEQVPQGERSEQFHKLVISMGKLGWGVDDIADRLKGTWAEEKFKARLRSEIDRSLNKIEIHEELGEVNVLMYKPDDIEEVIEWLWYPYLPLNEVTLLDGDGGVGKTAMMLRIAHDLIEGAMMPNMQKLKGVHRAMFISTESNYHRVTLPLLKRMGTKKQNAFYHVEDPKFVLTEEGIDRLQEWVEKLKLDLVVIDPLAQYLPTDVEMNNYQHSIYLMSRLQEVSQRMRCSIVLVRHNGKASKEQLGHRGIGSIGWSSSARSQLVVRRDPDDEDQYIVAATKHQHASDKDTRAFTYEWHEVNKRGIIEWSGMSDLTDDQLNAPKKDGNDNRQKKKDAEEWLREYLSERRTAADVYTQGEARGWSKRMLERLGRSNWVEKSSPARRPDGKPGTVTYWQLNKTKMH